MPRKPVWTEGLLVSQHHFQQQDRYHEELLRWRLGAVAHYDWGIIELELDERAIVSGQFKIKRLSAIWPDGTLVSAGGEDEEPPPAPRSFEAAFTADAEKLEIFVGLAHEAENAGNLEVSSEPSGRRFLSRSRPVSDTNTGGSIQEVDWARPNVRLFLGKERHDGFSVIRVAELGRQSNGQPIIRDNYVPPTLTIAGSPFLASGLRRVLAAVTARQRQLASERNERQEGNIDFHAGAARKFWLLHTLNASIPTLTHVLDTPRAHPEEAYLLLVTLIGQLSTFSTDSDPVSLPKFNYLELGSAFELLFARVLSLLSGGIQQHYVEIPLEHRPDGMFIGKIPDPKLTQHEFFLALKAPIPEALVRERVPSVLKIAAWSQMYDVVKQARQGARVEIEWKPTGTLPLKPGMCLFRVQKQGTYWEEIAKTATIALYLPSDADWASTAVSLFVVDPEHLR